jgi:tetratricopeptide (TPR) repeat protein
MNRSHKWLLLATLAGAVALAAGLCWAQPQTQTQAQKKVVEQQKQDETPYTEEEFNAYEAAVKEPDLAKRPVLLIAFMDKYPKSVLQVYIVNAYESLMAQYYEKHDYKTLEPLAEQWLKYKPDDLKTLAYLVNSAQNLGQDAKILEYGQKVYAADPNAQLASLIYQTYEKMGDQAKREEWALKLMAMPEFNDNFELRWLFVAKYAEKKELPKAADYAQQALKALALAKKPDAMSQTDWAKHTKDVEHACYNMIATNYQEQKKWDEAIQTYEKALKVKLYDGGYYYIGYCQWQKDDVDSAIPSFAKAEYLDGGLKAKATENLEKLYKSQHNQTLTGIDKVRNKAKLEIDALRSRK